MSALMGVLLTLRLAGAADLSSTEREEPPEGPVAWILTVSWNVLEAVVGLTAGFLAGSVALVGFALDSTVEASPGSILIWRLRTEQKGLQDS